MLNENQNTPLKIGMRLGAVVGLGMLLLNWVPYVGGILCFAACIFGLIYGMRHLSKVSSRVGFAKYFGTGFFISIFSSLVFAALTAIPISFVDLNEYINEVMKQMDLAALNVPISKKEMRETMESIFKPLPIFTIVFCFLSFFMIFISLIVAVFMPSKDGIFDKEEE